MSARVGIREKEAKAILTDFEARFKLDQDLFSSRPRLEKTQLQNTELILVDGKLLIFRREGRLLPTLRFDKVIQRLPRVVVDMGAISHICNGADVMVKGIRRIDGGFKSGDLVVVVDEKHGKSLAIGEALADSSLIASMEKGKAISNVHYVSDEVWNAAKG